MLSVEHVRDLARSDGGFSLVEMLVALSTGLVITLALFGLLEMATRQTRLVTDKVQSDRIGRLMMSRVVGDAALGVCHARSGAGLFQQH